MLNVFKGGRMLKTRLEGAASKMRKNAIKSTIIFSECFVDVFTTHVTFLIATFCQSVSLVKLKSKRWLRQEGKEKFHWDSRIIRIQLITSSNFSSKQVDFYQSQPRKENNSSFFSNSSFIPSTAAANRSHVMFLLRKKASEICFSYQFSMKWKYNEKRWNRHQKFRYFFSASILLA